MGEKFTAENLIKLPFKDVCVNQKSALETISGYTISPFLNSGFALKAEQLTPLYSSKNFISAFTHVLKLGKQYDEDLQGRDGGIVKAGYILDLMNLIKPEYQSDAIDMVFATAESLTKEKIVKELYRGVESVNELIAMFFGRATLALWLQEKYSNEVNDPLMEIYDSVNFFQQYSIRCKAKDLQTIFDFNYSYYGAWYVDLIRGDLIPQSTSIEDFFKAYSEGKLEDLIDIEKVSKSLPKFNDKVQ